MTKNKMLLSWIEEMTALTTPDKVVWITGDPKQLDELRQQALATGELYKLNEEKLPDCYLHRTAVNDVARVEHRTFICSRNKKDAGPTNNWMEPKEAYEKLGKIFSKSMKGRTMYVIPYSMGPVGSKFSKAVSYTHLRAHETVLDLVCRLLLEKKKNTISQNII